MKTILLCSDLDGTLIPNGDATESPGARKVSSQLAARKEFHLTYIARGDLHGLNGNYAAGVLEGLAHFFPETKGWLLHTIEKLTDCD